MSNKKKPLTYKSAGVDQKKSIQFEHVIRSAAKKTFSNQVISEFGGLASLFQPEFKNYNSPVIVSSADGVGTKIDLVSKLNKHRWIGLDLVAMCVNDLITCGAKPLFFLDYFVTGKLNKERDSDIIEGIADGCYLADMSLIGGETSEHPGIMKAKNYDLAGFCIGIIEKDKIISGLDLIQPGMKLIGLSSSGIHSNGFSLIRKILNMQKKESQTISHDQLVKFIIPSNIYVNIVQEVINSYTIFGMGHITGGGFFRNILRILPDNLGVNIYLNSWTQPDIFNIISKIGPIALEEMFSVFNMGIGYILFVNPDDSSLIIRTIQEHAKKYNQKQNQVIKYDNELKYLLSCYLINAYEIGEVIHLKKTEQTAGKTLSLNKISKRMRFIS
jgi:phosphoribosylformylglycinamidine cyclo-ligase